MLDRRGRGASAREPSTYAIQREADDLLAVLAAVGPAATVFAHSYGATVTLDALDRLPAVAALGACARPALPRGGPGVRQRALSDQPTGRAHSVWWMDDHRLYVARPDVRWAAIRRGEVWSTRRVKGTEALSHASHHVGLALGDGRPGLLRVHEEAT